jgi:hypothetical protein
LIPTKKDIKELTNRIMDKAKSKILKDKGRIIAGSRGAFTGLLLKVFEGFSTHKQGLYPT